MQGFGRVDAIEKVLASSYTPRLVSNVNKNIISAVEGTEWEASTNGRHFLNFCQFLTRNIHHG
jgi:hypothetical protein